MIKGLQSVLIEGPLGGIQGVLTMAHLAVWALAKVLTDGSDLCSETCC